MPGSWALVDGKWTRTKQEPSDGDPGSSAGQQGTAKTGSEDKMATYRGSVLKSVKSMDHTAQEHSRRDSTNPFSANYKRPEFDVRSADYGRPEAGSKTERRGIKAGNYVMREIVFLCEIIDKYGAKMPEGQVEIKFGPLFDLYATYSDKVVGMLLRARKYKLVEFEGEMLFQRQDDHKVITLLKPLSEIRASLTPSNDPKACIAKKD